MSKKRRAKTELRLELIEKRIARLEQAGAELAAAADRKFAVLEGERRGA